MFKMRIYCRFIANHKCENLKILMLPKDPNDDRNVMIEIRAGTGGSEANIFAGNHSILYCVEGKYRCVCLLELFFRKILSSFKCVF